MSPSHRYRSVAPPGEKLTLISLGSNLGDRSGNLNRAIHLMTESGLRPLQVTPILETEPLLEMEQPLFYNALAECSTTLAPYPLLHLLQKIERELGRIQRYRWGPREIDLDIVDYEGVELNEKDLTLPHPALDSRDYIDELIGLLHPLREEDGLQFVLHK